MKTILKGLRELAGVHGTMVSNGDGQVLAFDSAAIYDADLLGSVARSIARAIESVRLTQDDWSQINSQFAEGKLLIRRIGDGATRQSQGVMLSVISDNQLNPSFAMIAIRVAVGKLQKLVEGGALVPVEPIATAAERSSGVVVAPAASTLSASRPVAMPSSVPASSAQVAGSGLSWSGLSGASSLSASGVSVADEASAQMLTGLTKALARSVGPMAKVHVKDAVRRVCADRAFSRELAQVLISELAKSISNPAEAAKFRDLANKTVG